MPIAGTGHRPTVPQRLRPRASRHGRPSDSAPRAFAAAAPPPAHLQKQPVRPPRARSKRRPRAVGMTALPSPEEGLGSRFHPFPSCLTMNGPPRGHRQSHRSRQSLRKRIIVQSGPESLGVLPVPGAVSGKTATKIRSGGPGVMGIDSDRGFRVFNRHVFVAFSRSHPAPP